MSVFRKARVLSSQLKVACKQKPVLPICWAMMFVTKTYQILFSTFWLLYILSKTNDNK